MFLLSYSQPDWFSSFLFFSMEQTFEGATRMDCFNSPLFVDPDDFLVRNRGRKVGFIGGIRVDLRVSGDILPE